MQPWVYITSQKWALLPSVLALLCDKCIVVMLAKPQTTPLPPPPHVRRQKEVSTALATLPANMVGAYFNEKCPVTTIDSDKKVGW